MATFTPRTITFTRRRLQHAFRHAADFGIEGAYNAQSLHAFGLAITAHVVSTLTTPIAGSYRGVGVTHFLEPISGLNVIRDSNGDGWKLNEAQLLHLLRSGKLGGG